MHVIETIREFHTPQFSVLVEAIPEDSPDLSWDDTGETAEKINSGEWSLFCARARVVHQYLGEIASDYLGNFVYENIADFQDHRECAKYNREAQKANKNACCGSCFSDMVANVCREARETIRKAQNIKVR